MDKLRQNLAIEEKNLGTRLALSLIKILLWYLHYYIYIYTSNLKRVTIDPFNKYIYTEYVIFTQWSQILFNYVYSLNKPETINEIEKNSKDKIEKNSKDKIEKNLTSLCENYVFCTRAIMFFFGQLKLLL